jgi:hypothetical protein
VPKKKLFEDARTVLDVWYDTYRETCVALGLLDDKKLSGYGRDWICIVCHGESNEGQFAILLVFNEFGHHVGLFEALEGNG